MSENQNVPSGSNWQTRVGSAVALVGLLSVGVAGGVSSFIQQREDRRRAEAAASATPDVNLIALKTKTGDGDAGGGSPKDTKSEVSPNKNGISVPSGSKTLPSTVPAKTDDVPPPPTKEDAPRVEKTVKPSVEPTKNNDTAKTTDAPRPTGKEAPPTGEKSAKPSTESTKASGASKTKDTPAGTKESAPTVEKTAKPSVEPKTTVEPKPSDVEKAKGAPPTDKKKPTEPEKSSKVVTPRGKEKSGDETPPATEPKKAIEPKKALEPSKAAPSKTTAKPEPADPKSLDDMKVATIVVQVPADAKVYFDGQATRQVGSERTFVTPPLQRGKNFTYELKTEVPAEGGATSRTVRITVRAGEMMQLDSRGNISISSPGASK